MIDRTGNNIAKPDDERLSEADLLCLLSSHLERGFEDLVQGYKNYVYSIAYKLLCDSDLADDVAGEVWFKVYQTLTGYSPSRISQLQLLSWLATITKNKALDYLDKEKSRNRLTQQIGERLIEEKRLGFESPEYAVIRIEKGERIRSLVNRLPPRERVLIHLRYGIEIATPTISPKLKHQYVHEYFCLCFEMYQSDMTSIGISYKSLARALTYSPSYLRRHVDRALRQLRKEMEKEEISSSTFHRQEREGL